MPTPSLLIGMNDFRKILDRDKGPERPGKNSGPHGTLLRSIRFGVGKLDLGADGKDYRANSVHAPFLENLSTSNALYGLKAQGLARGSTMNDTSNPQVAIEKARDTYRKTAAQFEELTRDTEVPEAMRALAEKNIIQTRGLYERSKDAFEASVATFERSFDAAGNASRAVQPPYGVT
jgi:hypothetical protein